MPTKPVEVVPVPIFETRPFYPKDLADLKIQGVALVDFIVETDGSVQYAAAIRQTNEEFGLAAVSAVKRWKFKPGLKNGVPVRTHMQVPIYFDSSFKNPTK
jgi:protein TonB